MVSVDEVDPDGGVPDPGLALAGLADLDVLPAEDLGAAGRVDADGFRPIAPSSKDLRSRAIVRSGKPRSSNPRASNVEAQARRPPLARAPLSVESSLDSRSNGSSPAAGQTTMSRPLHLESLRLAYRAGASRWMWVSIRSKSTP
jgi:hypothetical protein